MRSACVEGWGSGRGQRGGAVGGAKGVGQVEGGLSVCWIEELLVVCRQSVVAVPLQSPFAMWSSFTMYRLRPSCE